MKPIQAVMVAVLTGIVTYIIVAACGVYDKPQTASTTQIAELNYALGYANGWHDQFGDGAAITSYHERANALPDDDDPSALQAVWAECITEAKERDAVWGKLTADQKREYAAENFVPFWKKSIGEPRRFSRAGAKRFQEVLKNGGK